MEETRSRARTHLRRTKREHRALGVIALVAFTLGVLTTYAYKTVEEAQPTTPILIAVWFVVAAGMGGGSLVLRTRLRSGEALINQTDPILVPAFRVHRNPAERGQGHHTDYSIGVRLVAHTGDTVDVYLRADLSPERAKHLFGLLPKPHEPVEVSVEVPVFFDSRRPGRALFAG